MKVEKHPTNSTTTAEERAAFRPKFLKTESGIGSQTTAKRNLFRGPTLQSSAWQESRGSASGPPTTPTAQEKKGLFGDVNKLRRGEDAAKSEAAVYNSTRCGKLAADKRFELTTMIIISLNAIVIGYDADYTARWSRPDGLYDGPVQFIIFEIFFTVYFSAEILVRFIAFKNKLDCWKDKWFMFDGLLVFLMVLETLVIETVIKPNTGGQSPVAGASSLRLLRILRVTRMTRLMRSFPEIMTIVKGLAASVRTVLWTGVILFLLTYTWAVVFTSEFHQGRHTDQEILDCAGDETVEAHELESGIGRSPNTCQVQVFFGSMGKSMASLLVMGAVLDDVTACSDSIRKSKSPAYLGFFLLYIVFASFTLLNMLTGILCEVVNATSEGEKVKSLRAKLKEAIDSIESLDVNRDGHLSKEEFKRMRDISRIKEALEELDIDDSELQKYYEYFFGTKGPDGKEPVIHVEAMTQAIMRTRPGMRVSALDVGTVKQAATETHVKLHAGMQDLISTLKSCAASAEDAATARARLGGAPTAASVPRMLAVPPPPSASGSRPVTPLLSATASTSRPPSRMGPPPPQAAPPATAARSWCGDGSTSGAHLRHTAALPPKVWAKLQTLSQLDLISEVERRLAAEASSDSEATTTFPSPPSRRFSSGVEAPKDMPPALRTSTAMASVGS